MGGSDDFAATDRRNARSFAYEPPRLLRLRAEMRLPGEAWMEWVVEDEGPGRSLVRQRALFVPRGLLGRLYWYLVLPFQGLIFGQLARDIARRAAATDGSVGSAR